MSVDFKLPEMKKKASLISEKMIKALNYRIEQEEYSSRIYLAMSMWLNNEGFVNASKLWLQYSKEELGHADFSREYLLSLGIQPKTPKLDAPKEDYTGLPEIIKLSFEHETEITNQCKQLADEAFKECDHMLYELAAKYLKEQIEEMDKTQTLMDKLKQFGEDKIAMRFMEADIAEQLG
jgi:ferritin